MTIRELGEPIQLEQGYECKCSGCIETEDILDNGYCEECFDQACDQEDSNNH